MTSSVSFLNRAGPTAFARPPERRLLDEPFKLPAWAETEDGKLVPCTLFNVTNEGAQICIDEQAALAGRFALRLTQDGKLRRGCRTLWRRGNCTSVRFFTLPKADTVPS